MSIQPPRRYQIPTHLNTPDKLDLPLFGITVSLTLRQGVCFLLGGSLVYQTWQQSFGMVGFAGEMMHWIVPTLLAFATYVFAVHQVQDRHLEGWILVLIQYLGRPKVFVWRPVLSAGAQIQAPSAETPAPDLHDWDDEEKEDQ